MLYSLGQFYRTLNQPLREAPVRLRTSKIVFIELLGQSNVITKQERAIYKNLEDLEAKNLIAYEQKMIRFTDKGVHILQRINKEIKQFVDVGIYFSKVKPKRKLQTVIK
jgi:DNA-binding PadR family transcriptional regulator